MKRTSFGRWPSANQDKAGPPVGMSEPLSPAVDGRSYCDCYSLTSSYASEVARIVFDPGFMSPKKWFS